MSSLKRNILSLYGVQIANYAIPLATLPWLTRVLGPAGYGQMSFVAAVSTYFVLLADYGFNLSATRSIAIHRDDLAGRSSVFWHTLTVKAALAIVGILILIPALLISGASSDIHLYLLGYTSVLGSVLTPTWYFQGTERLAVLSGINLAVRALSVPAVFLCVTAPTDISPAIAINSAPSVVVGVVCMLLLWKQRALAPARVRLAGLVASLRDGWHIFLSTASISLYSTTNAVLLGAMAGKVEVGYFAAGEKLVKAVQYLLTPVSQSVYPRVSYLMHHAREEALSLLRNLVKLQGSISLALSLFLLFAAPFLVTIVYGERFSTTVDVLRWMAFVPFAVGLSNVFGVQAMLPLGMHKAFSAVLLFAGIFNVIALAGLAALFGARGAAMAVLATETLVTTLMGICLLRNRALIFGLTSC